MTVRIRDLGTLELERDGVVTPVTGGRLTTLLAALLVRSGGRVDADTLLHALSSDDRTATATLDTHLWRLRRLVEPDHRRGKPFEVIVNDAGGFRLIASAEQVDSALFEKLADEVDARLAEQSPDQALAVADRALALWRGSPWEPHTHEEWAMASAARLDERRSRVAEQRIEALLAVGRVGPALADLEVLLTEHPLHEHLWALRMIATYRAGKPSDALDTFAKVRRLIRDELGIDPGFELQDLQARILAEDPALAAQARATTMAEEARASAVDTPRVDVRLPVQRARVRGREGDVDALRGLVGPGRLVTIVGAAGCGKTTLAVQVAARLTDAFPDGVCFVDLTSAADGAQVIDAVSSTLRLGTRNGGDLDQMLGGLAARRLLIVLDNCEQVIDDVADLIDIIVRPGAGLGVLATSREALGVDAETVWSLRPLTTPDPGPDGNFDIDPDRVDEQPAVALFLDRLRAVLPERAIGRAEVQLAARVCAALDGLPLAIELAASQTRSFSLEEIAERVQQDPVGLSRIGRGGPRHHASLRSTIESSSAALTDDERWMHQAVSVVPGPFSIELAAVLAQTSPERTRDLLGALVHHSMLSPLGPREPGRPSRFAQLVTLRAHALSTVSEETHRALVGRRNEHIRNLVGEIPDIGHRSEGVIYGQIEDDLAAVRATLQSCLVDHPDPAGSFIAGRLGIFWYARGMPVEWDRWTALGLANATADPFDRLQCRVSRISALMMMKQPSPDLDGLEDAFTDLDREQSMLVGQYVLAAASSAALVQDHALTIRAATLGRALADATGSERLDLLARGAELFARLAAGEPAGALAEADDAYRRAVDVDNRFAQLFIVTAATGAAAMAGDMDAGIRWSDRSLALDADLGLGGNSYTLEVRGGFLAMLNHPTEAIEVFAASRAFAQRSGWTWPMVPQTLSLLEQARAQLSAADADDAERRGSKLTGQSFLAASPTTDEPDAVE